jgi:NAD(P)-dependent dehydrogenase (short-subunit alcohol dehydrogenase family)
MGKAAAEQINAEMGAGKAGYIQVDVGDEGSVQNLYRQVIRNLKRVDIVINNATVAPVGAVIDTPILDWDISYRVNLRGPALMARAFLPDMVARKSGVFVCVSSVGDAYMASYETMKSAQVHLAHILDIELEGSGVIVFTIGPGLVMTTTAQTQIKKLALLYGKTVDEFYEMSKEHIISVEEAGAGFAAAVVYAERFKGNEVDSRIALNAAGIEYGAPQAASTTTAALSTEYAARAVELCREVRAIMDEQVQGWAKRPLFERQWVVRDFKKYAGMPAEQCLDTLAKLESCLETGDLSNLPGREIPGKLAQYFIHYQELSQGFFKDKQKLEETMVTLEGWQEKAEELAKILS